MPDGGAIDMAGEDDVCMTSETVGRCTTSEKRSYGQLLKADPSCDELSARRQ